jgi:hypothetical protein
MWKQVWIGFMITSVKWDILMWNIFVVYTQCDSSHPERGMAQKISCAL